MIFRQSRSFGRAEALRLSAISDTIISERFCECGRPGKLIGIDLAVCYKNLMKLTPEEVQRVAMLARLKLTQEEEERLTKELGNILQYVGKLNQLNTSGIEPFTHPVDTTTPMREDIVTNEPSTEPLLANAPSRENNFFKVPKIIE